MVETGTGKKPRALTFREALDAAKAQLGRELTGPELEEVHANTILGLLLEELADEAELDREAGIG